MNQNLVEEVENDESESDEIDPSLPQDKFHAQDFEKFWINYKSKIRNTNTPLFNVLDTVIWRIDNQMNVHLLFDSGTMEIEFDRVKEDFVRSARKSLNNYALRVISDVSKDVTTVSHIKSRRNIYDELVEKYPIVDKFTRSLGLDIENEPD